MFQVMVFPRKRARVAFIPAQIARLLLPAVLMLSVTSSLSASDEAEKKAVRRLLSKSIWTTDLSARKTADTAYREAVIAGGIGPKLLAARTLVHIRQRRYREAMQAADDWVSVSPNSIAARRAQAWLRVFVRDYQEALVRLERYATTIAAAPAPDREAHIRLLGSVYGYLDAVPVKGVSLDQIRDSGDRAERALGPDGAMLLEARRNTVRKHIALVARKDATVAATEAASAAERDRRLREIEERRTALNARTEELRNDQTRLQEEMKKRLAEINDRLKPLNNSLAKVDADGRAVNRELSSIVSEIAYLESLLAFVRDPFLRDQYYRDILRLDRLAAQYEGDAIRLERQAASIYTDRSQVANDGLVERNRVGQELGRNDRELEQIRGARRRTEIEERRARRPDRAAVRQNRVYGAQIESLTTYAPFPLERARAELLDEVKK